MNGKYLPRESFLNVKVELEMGEIVLKIRYNSLKHREEEIRDQKDH